MSEEQEAEQLARWLEQPGSEPPPGVDPELLGSIYRLSPKHRPAPRVTVEEILAGVKEGPFAVAEGRRDRIRSSGADPVAPPPSRKAAAPAWRRWVLPTVGVAAAGMLVMLVVVPSALLLSDQEPTYDASMPMPEMAAATPPSKPIKEGSEARSSGERRLPASEQPSSPMLFAPPPTPKVAAPSPVASGPAVGTGGTEEKPLFQAREPAADLDGGDLTAADAAAPPPPVSAPVENTAMPEPNSAALADEDYEEQEVIAEAQKAKKETADGSRRVQPRTASSAPAAPAAQAQAEAGAAFSEEEDNYEPPVWPTDYRERWYAGDAEVEPIYQAAATLERGGQWTAAAVAYRPLMSSGRSTVAQDAAWHCASAWWKGGQATAALAAVDEGLRRSSANTAYRARLFALKGDIYAAQGKDTQAEAAWREARALNASR